ncbi:MULTISPECIES: hypothetical protein [Inquilinus]|jgi:hypothetical protein|uniref:Secreted protein n=1 Tax=Inquilinus ginsengisoli TaxID=363840 RepID=A0ABU1JM16_9PROT|nr:hypothetical protein [Inquilinus ginsengisoli]MDR6288589.1 hypothetical protein [Inquilinus ginsengisoli]
MDMFATVILVCAAALPQRDCNRDTAVDVVAGPAASSPLGCGFGGQAMLASTALGPELGEGRYLKVLCIDRQRAQSQARLP